MLVTPQVVSHYAITVPCRSAGSFGLPACRSSTGLPGGQSSWSESRRQCRSGQASPCPIQCPPGLPPQCAAMKCKGSWLLVPAGDWDRRPVCSSCATSKCQTRLWWKVKCDYRHPAAQGVSLQQEEKESKTYSECDRDWTAQMAFLIPIQIESLIPVQKLRTFQALSGVDVEAGDCPAWDPGESWKEIGLSEPSRNTAQWCGFSVASADLGLAAHCLAEWAACWQC